ncbi:MAG: SDR family NAD(P)-dependent oxidoreductase [Methylobacteriaceae bacterium]|nr:SDR family NAD(P)-dependent oxidoreductase [Methylobacteriaceae bacterium]
MYRASPNEGIAWITGASSGIGRGVAIELARRGYRVAATARRADVLAVLAREAQGFGGDISAHPADVTDASGIAGAINEIETSRGAIVLAFLNAGSYFIDAPESFGGEGFRRTFELNVGGTANCLGPVLRSMRPRGRGQIAINASLAGYGGLPQAAAYGASKAALINLAESLRLSLADTGISIQVVTPGFVRTPMNAQNKYPMPFTLPADDAARRICDGFERGGFEITFPKRLAWPMKAINLLPYPLYFWIVGRLTGGHGRAR